MLGKGRQCQNRVIAREYQLNWLILALKWMQENLRQPAAMPLHCWNTMSANTAKFLMKYLNTEALFLNSVLHFHVIRVPLVDLDRNKCRVDFRMCTILNWNAFSSSYVKSRAKRFSHGVQYVTAPFKDFCPLAADLLILLFSHHAL